jgi:hypothetical protein
MTTSDRLYLDVPFQEKEEAKVRGARWDPVRRQWWVDPRRVPREQVARWLPLPALTGEVKGRSAGRVRLMGLPIDCWRCGRTTKALVGLLPFASRTIDNLLLCDDEAVLRLAAELLGERGRQAHQVGRIKSRYSRTVGHAYLSNGCFHCDAILGDFPLYHEELPLALEDGNLTSLTELAVADIFQANSPLLLRATRFDAADPEEDWSDEDFGDPEDFDDPGARDLPDRSPNLDAWQSTSNRITDVLPAQHALMQTGIIAAPTYDMGQAVVDQPLDASLAVVWQLPLTGFHTRDARLDSVSGVAMLTSRVRGVLALGADPPDLGSDAGWWPVPVRVGSSYPGQLLAIDDSGLVYRLSPGRVPMPVLHTHRPNDVCVVGLPGGRLLVSSFDPSWTDLVEEATGQTMWRSPVGLVGPVMPVGDQLIGGASPMRGDLVSLDVRTGLERWRRPATPWLAWPDMDMVAVVGGVLWNADSLNNQLVGFSVDAGRPVATVVLPRRSRLTGVLDQAGNLHIGDEHGWLVVDLTQARMAADVRFESSGIGAVYAKRTVRSADGRLVLADDHGQVFVVHPAQPHRPELVATCPQIQGLGIAAGRLIVLSYDGTLTALGAPHSSGDVAVGEDRLRS